MTPVVNLPAIVDYFQAYPKLSLLATALISAYAIRAFQLRDDVKRNLPPGPKGIPIFGNFFQLSKKAWEDFERWGKEFGKFTLYLESLESICERLP
jgi:hypothetical protein